MRDRQQRALRAERRKPPGRAAVELELRRTAAAHDLDVPPQHLLRVSRAERLHAGFLGREPSGKVDRGHAAAIAIGNFPVGEDAAQKPLAVALDRGGDAIDFRGVKTEPDDVRHV